MLTTVETYELRSRRDVYGLLFEAPAMAKNLIFGTVVYAPTEQYIPAILLFLNLFLSVLSAANHFIYAVKVAVFYKKSKHIFFGAKSFFGWCPCSDGVHALLFQASHLFK
jgi:hypothetical protein